MNNVYTSLTVDDKLTITNGYRKHDITNLKAKIGDKAGEYIEIIDQHAQNETLKKYTLFKEIDESMNSITKTSSEKR